MLRRELAQPRHTVICQSSLFSTFQKGAQIGLLRPPVVNVDRMRTLSTFRANQFPIENKGNYELNYVGCPTLDNARVVP